MLDLRTSPEVLASESTCKGRRHGYPVSSIVCAEESFTIIDDEKRSLFYHPDKKIIHHRIKGGCVGCDFRDLLTTGAEWMERHGATKWLSDDRDNRVVAPEDGEWGEREWGPRVIKAGFKYWRIVVPGSAVGSLQMRRLAEEYRQYGVTVQIFSDLQAALDWLGSVP